MIGRKKEINELNAICDRDSSSLVTMYGRRRIGKTYLINYMFKEKSNDCLLFEFTGSSNLREAVQIANFIEQVYEWFKVEPKQKISDWSSAFRFLKRTIDSEIEKSSSKEKIIIFIDEIAWIDPENKSDFLSALGYFWNTYCEIRKNIIMILCGSNASWIKNKILGSESTGPLHNRVTDNIPLYPFTLKETKEYLIQEKGFIIDNKKMLEIYMVFGGVAKYLSFLNPNKSLNQNIDHLFFNINGLMYNEYDEVFNSLFIAKSSKHKKVIDFICSKRIGFSSKEIRETFSLKGIDVKTILNELEFCGFIIGISKFNNKTQETKYIISDPYVLFHHHWIKKISKNDILKLNNNHWQRETLTQKYKIWCGFSFEMVMQINIKDYISQQGMSGLNSNYGYWQYISDNVDEKGAQIDIFVDYGTGQIDIIECKYYNKEFSITKDYSDNLNNKLEMFKKYGSKKKNIELRLVFLTIEGLKKNQHFHNLSPLDITFDDILDN